MTRPVAGSDRTKVSCSGMYGSRTVRSPHPGGARRRAGAFSALVYSGGLLWNAGGFPPVKPFALGGIFGLSPNFFAESAKSSPKIPLPLEGRLLIAFGQSVAAGCCAAGTPSIQTRHMPFGGRESAGITFPFFALSFCAAPCAMTGAAVATMNPHESTTNHCLTPPPLPPAHRVPRTVRSRRGANQSPRRDGRKRDQF